MRVEVRKWGNSAAVRLPAPALKDAGMQVGQSLELRVEEGRLDQQDDRHLAQFEAAVTEFPEVMECYLMTGEADYQLRVLVGSLGEFEDFLRHRLTRIAGVAQVTTSFALRPVVYRTALPVG